MVVVVYIEFFTVSIFNTLAELYIIFVCGGVGLMLT